MAALHNHAEAAAALLEHAQHTSAPPLESSSGGGRTSPMEEVGVTREGHGRESTGCITPVLMEGVRGAAVGADGSVGGGIASALVQEMLAATDQFNRTPLRCALRAAARGSTETTPTAGLETVLLLVSNGASVLPAAQGGVDEAEEGEYGPGGGEHKSLLMFVLDPEQPWSGARFQRKFTLDDAIGSHACSLEANHACDQWHSSRKFTPLTGWHCKLRPNTEGSWRNAGSSLTFCLLQAGT
jgi:hypothetical protein